MSRVPRDLIERYENLAEPAALCDSLASVLPGPFPSLPSEADLDLLAQAIGPPLAAISAVEICADALVALSDQPEAGGNDAATLPTTVEGARRCLALQAERLRALLPLLAQNRSPVTDAVDETTGDETNPSRGSVPT